MTDPIRMGMWAALAGLFGLAIGSFLNVVAYRVPAGLSVISPPSACPRCGHEIRNRHNVPVIGWLLLRGRCFDCHAPISARYPLVEAVTGLLFATLTFRLLQLHLSAAVAAYAVVAAAVVTVTLIEVDVGRLPTSVPLLVGALAVVAFTEAAIVAGQEHALARALLASGAAMFAGLLLAARQTRLRRIDVVPYLALLLGAVAYRSWVALAVLVGAGVVAALGIVALRRGPSFVAAVGPLALVVLVLPGLAG